MLRKREKEIGIMDKKNWQKLHSIIIVKVAQHLKRKNPENKIIPDVKRHGRPKITLTDGQTIFPDIIDETRKRIYEVHVGGERKSEYLEKLPKGWAGINIFYDEEDCPETIVFKEKSQRIEEISW